MSANSLGLHVYNRHEGNGPWWKAAQWDLHPTVASHYLGTIFKGWWRLGRNSFTDYFQIEIALGGEDSMFQLGVVLPFLLRFHVGVKLPRRFVRSWVYERREWGLRIGYIGRSVELLVASDEHMRDTGMVEYYRWKRARGEHLAWSRAQLWPGWHLTLRSLPRPKPTTTKGTAPPSPEKEKER